MESFPQRLRVAMAANGLTVRDVIARSKLPKSHVYRILNGEINPTPATRARLIMAVFAKDIGDTRITAPAPPRSRLTTR